MSISIKDIAWIAGLLEGEGNFDIKALKYPVIKVGSTDLDVIERARILMDKTRIIEQAGRREGKDHWKDFYHIAIRGNMAIQWMMTIYPLMGIRRRAKIRECLESWKNHETNLKSIPSPETRELGRATRRFRKLDFTDNEVRLASNLKKMGLSDEVITRKIDKSRHFLDNGVESPLTSKKENDIVEEKTTIN